MSGWLGGWFQRPGSVADGSNSSTSSGEDPNGSSAAPDAAASQANDTPADIRERRLKKLQATSAAAAAAPSGSATSSSTSVAPTVEKEKLPPASAATSAPIPTPTTTVTQTPAATVASPPKQPLAAAIIAPTATTPVRPSSAAPARPSTAVSPSSAASAITYSTDPEVRKAEYEHESYSDILQVSVAPPAAGSRPSATRVFLPQLSEDLMSDRKDASLPKLERSMLDSLMLERLGQLRDSSSTSSASSSGGSSNSLGWLLNSYRRALTHLAKIETSPSLSIAPATPLTASSAFPANSDENEFAQASIRVAMGCLVRYTGLLLSDDEMLQNAAQLIETRAEFLRLLGSDGQVSRALPNGFFESLVQTYENEETFLPIFKPLLETLMTPLKFAPSNSRLGELAPEMEPAQRTILALSLMVKCQATARLICLHPSFLPRVPNGRMLMTISTLGPLLSLATASTEPGFQQVINRQQQYEVENEVLRLRTSYSTYQLQCAQLFRNGIKQPMMREHLLQWLASLVTSNAPRRRMQYHPFEVSSDGVFYNAMHVTLRLCQPIIKKTTKADFDKVNLQYLLQTAGGRIDYDTITRVQASLADVKQLRSTNPPPALTPNVAPYSPYNFVTEIFFLTHEILHEGLASIVRRYTELMQEVSRVGRQLQSMDPQALMYGQLQSQLDMLFAMNLATRVHLQDPALVNEVIAFYDWTSKWIRSHQLQLLAEKEKAAASGTDVNAVTAALASSTINGDAAASASSTPAASGAAATPATLPIAALIPETIVEDIVEFFIYMGRFQPIQLQELPQASYSGILDLILALAAGPFQLKNPHLRASLAEFLLFFLPQDRVATNEHIFNTHPGMLESLVPSLLELYVSVEDGRGMYYQKYSARNNISLLIEFLWQLPAHKAKLLSIANACSPVFMKFINMLANDLIFLLDEGLKLLGQIREVQLEMDDDDKWRGQPVDTLRERERSFAQNEQGATSCLTLANTTVHMLFYLTSEIITPFVAPEFVERMAQMLDLYINQLVGPKITDLKVRNREKYAFKPRDLLQEIIGIWLHLAHNEEFLNKVACDERSYRVGVFAKAARIMRNRAIMPERSIARFEQYNRQVESLSESLLKLEEILGDIPDEYQDGLMGTLMTDPVQLPQSKQVVDRATINRQLMNKKIDPFSNTPLTEDMLVDKPELKAEIAAWVEKRKKEWREAKQKSDENDQNTTAEDEEDKPAPASSSTAATAPAVRKSYLDDDD